MTFGRWVSAERSVIERLRATRSTTLVAASGTLDDEYAASLDVTLERVLGRAAWDALVVAPTRAAAVAAARAGIDAAWIDDVVLDRYWRRDSLDALVVVEAHRFGVRTLAALLDAVAPFADDVVLVGDTFARDGAPRDDDPGTPFVDLARAAHAASPVWLHVDALGDPPRSMRALGALDVSTRWHLARRRFDEAFAAGVFRVVASLDDVPAAVRARVPPLYAVASHVAATVEYVRRDDDDDDRRLWKRAARAGHSVHSHVLLEDDGELVRVDRVGYAKRPRPLARDWLHVADALAMRCARDDDALDQHGLFVVTSDASGVSHARCCHIDDARARAIDVAAHAPYVVSWPAWSARRLAAQVAAPIADATYVMVGDDDATLDDIVGAAALAHECVYVVVADAGALTAACERRARAPWTRMRALVEANAADAPHLVDSVHLVDPLRHVDPLPEPPDQSRRAHLAKRVATEVRVEYVGDLDTERFRRRAPRIDLDADTWCAPPGDALHAPSSTMSVRRASLGKRQRPQHGTRATPCVFSRMVLCECTTCIVCDAFCVLFLV